MLPVIAEKEDDQIGIGNEFEAEQNVQLMNDKPLSPSNDQDQMKKMLINLSPHEKFEFIKSVNCEVRKLTEKFNEVEININILIYSSLQYYFPQRLRHWHIDLEGGKRGKRTTFTRI